MNIIEELYYGNIEPCNMGYKKGSEYDKMLIRTIQLDEELQQLMSDQAKEAYAKYIDTTNRLSSIAEREAFVKGFTIGAKIVIEIMKSEN